MSSKKKQKDALEAAPPPIKATVWPDATPSIHEEKIVSVVCGNTHLHWAFHEGKENHFSPTLFWRTPQLSEDEMNLSPAVALSRHLPEAAHNYIFGQGEDPTKEMAHHTMKKLRVPLLSVYVVSTNDDQARRLAHLWKEVPSRLYMMQGNDFFTKQQGRYDGMGSDRLAVLYAAANISGFPALVFDGGTAMTYTAADGNGNIMGGGITLGLGGKLRSLADFTGALPHIHPDEILRLVSQAENGEAFPVFAQDTKKGILVSVLGEVAHSGRNIIKQWLKKVGPAQKDDSKAAVIQDEGAPTGADASGQVGEMKTGGLKLCVGEPADDGSNKKRRILVTGGDAEILARLLEPNHSGVVELEPGTTPVPRPEYEIQKVKHMIHYGIGALLEKKVDLRSTGDPFVEEWDTALIGQRVAKKFPIKDADGDFVFRGTVASISRGKSRDKDLFLIRYDDDDTEDLNARELHDALILYSTSGEKSIRKTNGLLRETEKTDASKAAAAMVQGVIQKSKSPDRAQNGGTTGTNKRAAPESGTSRASKRSKKPVSNASPRSYIGKRIAKYFDLELFFGDVIDYEEKTRDEDEFWHISYDDGDSEDMSQDELNEGLELYEQKKYDDSKYSGTLENSTEEEGATAPVDDSKGTEKPTPASAYVAAPVAAPVVTPAETENAMGDGEANKASEPMEPNRPFKPSLTEEEMDSVAKAAATGETGDDLANLLA